jgi:hypothetical protein
MNPIQKIRAMSERFRAASAPGVHFHRGPQGHPMPCYDAACPMPHLSGDDLD